MECQFWETLQLLLEPLPYISSLWESFRNNPSPPLQLIEKTVCQGAVFLTPESSLNLSRVTPKISLSASQQVALKLCLTNSSLMVVQGIPGSGKTRLTQVLAQGLIEQQKQILLLTHHSKSLSAYDFIKGAFQLKFQDYSTWKREIQQHLGKQSMDFLPIHLLPDSLLAKLRSSRKLEKWLSILSLQSDDIEALLQSEFPESSPARLSLLAYRLQKLLPLLRQQLQLHQLSARLSEEAINNLATQIKKSVIPVLGTVSDFLHPQHQLEEMAFDCVIVEEAQYLTWGELIFLAGITQKLILLGIPSHKNLQTRTHFSKYAPLSWLGEFLSPAYCYQLNEQFRVHSHIAKPIFETLYGKWVRTQPRSDALTLPQLTARLQWQDLRATPAQQVNPWEGNRVLRFMSELGYAGAKNIGILAFTEAQRDWLRANCSPQFREVFIGSFTDWVGEETKVLLISCVGEPERLTAQNLAIALTRASDYLILFGNYSLWLTQSSPLQPLLKQRELQREREVSLV